MSDPLRKTVLLVEDDLDLRNVIADVLRDNGYAMLLAANGEEALQRLQAEGTRPSLILLDLMMPAMNGWELLQELKSDSGFSQIPIVVLTAFHQTHTLGTEAYLRKPVPLETLLDTVSRYCAD
jgi:CheY-like chemotaxis protein